MKGIVHINCKSIKNKIDKHLQCPYKKKLNSDFCGKHLNTDNVVLYQDVFDKCNKEHNDKENINNEHIINNSLHINDIDTPKNIISKTILTKDELLDNISKNIQMDIYTIRTSIKNSSLAKIIQTKQSKSNLLNELNKIILQERFYKNNVYFIIKIQSCIRRWIITRRAMCVNDSDILGMIDKYEIPSIFFYPFYDDLQKKYYAYDIRSLNNLIHSNYCNCPYTLRIFNEEEKENVFKHIHKLEKYGIIIEEEILLDENQELEMKIKDLFYNINMLDNYTNHEWFLSLNIISLINLYIKAEDIWNYRAMLSQEAKEKIIGNEIIFEIPINIIKYTKSIPFMRTILLRIFNAMISNGIDINEKKLGAILVLSALVEVSPEAFEAMPHLAQI